MKIPFAPRLAMEGKTKCVLMGWRWSDVVLEVLVYIPENIISILQALDRTSSLTPKLRIDEYINNGGTGLIL
jgi:hypothetical protein